MLFIQNMRQLVLFLRKQGRIVFSLVALPLIVFLAYSLNFFNIGGISNAVEQRYISFVTHTTQKTLSGDIRLIYMDEEQVKELLKRLEREDNRDPARLMTDDYRPQLLREFHAKLISNLEGAGAAAVAFDFTFPPANDAASKANKAFADAARNIRDRGRTRIVIGAEGQSTDKDTDKELGQVFSRAYQGNIHIGGFAADTGNRKMLRRIAIAFSEGRSRSGQIDERLVVPVPMPLLLLGCAKQPGNPVITFRLDTERGEITLYENGKPTQRRIRTEVAPCNKDAQNCEVSDGFEWGRMALLPLVMPYIDSGKEAPYVHVLDAKENELSDYADKIVIIGARYEKEIVPVPGSDPGVSIYGYQVHAAVLDDLLHNSYPRSLSLIAQLLMFYALAAFALLGRRLLPGADVKMNTYVFGERLVPVGLLILIVIYAVGGVVLYSMRHLILKVEYDLVVLTAAYFAFGSKAAAPVKKQTNGPAPK